MKVELLFYFVLGTVIGSFLAVCSVRLPQGKSLLSPSCCAACGHPLYVRDLIPLVSFALLRGRCRYCGTMIPRQLPAIELLTGSLFLFAGTVILQRPALYLAWCFLACLVWEAATDLREMIIPDEAVLLLLVTGGIWCQLYQTGIGQPLYGALTGLCVLGLIRFISRGGMGLGDIKLAGALGIWLGASGMAVCLALAFLTGGVAGLLLWLCRRAEGAALIPFGPFLALGALLSFFYAPAIQSWYWTLLL